MPAQTPAAQPAHGGRRPARHAAGAAEPGAERLLALSDGVVAIALTLLVLQLKVPSQLAHPDSAAELARQLTGNGSQLISYVVSYYVIAHFWLVHFRVFRRVSGHRESLAWWNFAFLFTITVMPFTSSLMGEFSSNPLAIDIFAINLMLASLATQATLVFGHRTGAISPEPDRDVTRASRARALAVVLVVGLSIGLSWVSTSAAQYSWALLPFAQWAFARLISRRTAR